MVDLDNFMLGNPLIVTENQNLSYEDEIFKGSKYDPS